MQHRSQIATVAALVVAALLALTGCGSGDEEPLSLVDGEPQLVSVTQLARFAADSPVPVYWVGPEREVGFELTKNSGGEVYLRYLPPEAKAGDPRSEFLTVGSYPSEDGPAALRRAARSAGVELEAVDGDGLLLAEPDSRSVYLTFPGADFQVELYSPLAGEAKDLAMSGRLTPVP